MFPQQELGWTRFNICNVDRKHCSHNRNWGGLDLTFVILIGSSVPKTVTGVVLDLTFVRLSGSSVLKTGTGVD